MQQQPRACNGKTDSLAYINAKIDRNAQCIAARQRINNTCYRGGDANHKQAPEEAQNALMTCQRLKAKLEGKNSAQSAFLKKMEAITGLTGAALIAYLAISEGSRLFPPRNLVPVP